MVTIRHVIVSLAACTPTLSEAPQAIDLVTPWARSTIASGWLGADGVATADINGDGWADFAAAWEQGNVVTISLSQSGPSWVTTAIPNVVAAEDVAIGDIDGDGQLDVVSATEDRRLRIHHGPAWTTTTIATATNVQRWMQVRACDVDADGDLDLVAGGRIGTPAPAHLGWFEAPAWTWHPIAPAGWTMTVACLDLDGDGDLDVATTDRAYYQIGTLRHYERIGSSWYEQTAAGWTWHYAGRDLGEPKFGHFAPGIVIDGAGSDTQPNAQTLRYSVDGRTWGTVAIAQPSGVGWYHDVEPADIDGDGSLDLVVSYSQAAGVSGVVWLRGPSWTRGEISGVEGTKFDNAIVLDVDHDGWLDVVTSEQIDQLGVVWYRNPGG